VAGGGAHACVAKACRQGAGAAAHACSGDVPEWRRAAHCQGAPGASASGACAWSRRRRRRCRAPLLATATQSPARTPARTPAAPCARLRPDAVAPPSRLWPQPHAAPLRCLPALQAGTAPGTAPAAPGNAPLCTASWLGPPVGQHLHQQAVNVQISHPTRVAQSFHAGSSGDGAPHSFQHIYVAGVHGHTQYHN
jgi:hypothetical protein